MLCNTLFLSHFFVIWQSDFRGAGQRQSFPGAFVSAEINKALRSWSVNLFTIYIISPHFISTYTTWPVTAYPPASPTSTHRAPEVKPVGSLTNSLWVSAVALGQRFVTVSLVHWIWIILPGLCVALHWRETGGWVVIVAGGREGTWGSGVGGPKQAPIAVSRAGVRGEGQGGKQVEG